MNTVKRVTLFFIAMILIIYSLSIFYDYIRSTRIREDSVIALDKSRFLDMENPSYDISDREISHGESKIHRYNAVFDRNVFGENVFLMIEKPDSQHFEVKLNGEMIGEFGDRGGKANLWNGTYYIRFSKELLKEKNEIIITMYSDYVTGLGGGIFLLAEKDYKFMSYLSNAGNEFIGISLVITFFASIILMLFIAAWKDHIYNIMTYRYFLLSILSIGIASFDYTAEQFLMMDYLAFKKIIMLSMHLAVMFGALGVSSLLNSKYKLNFGMITVAATVYSMFTTTNMIDFRNFYQILNIFLIFAIFQIIFTIFIYRKRASVSAGVLLTGFSMCLISTTKLVFVNNNLLSGGVQIDIPVMIIIYTGIVLFLFYLELVQMADDSEVSELKDEKMGVTNYMQGSFIIDRRFVVVGKYSSSCDYIFDKVILGENVLELMPLVFEDGEHEGFFQDALKLVFDKNYKYKDGILALLPSIMSLDERIYQVNYSILYRSDILLQIILSDITKGKELENRIKSQKEEYNLIINALKFKNETLYFINKVMNFIEVLKKEGFSTENLIELHTLKGNLGQMGFREFEEQVHEVENLLSKENYSAEELIEKLEKGFEGSINLLEKHLESDYFDKAYSEFNVNKNDIMELEELCFNFSEKYEIPKYICDKIRNLRYVDFKNMFSRYSDYIEKISGKMEKSVFPFQLTGDCINVNPEKAEEILNSFVGIFRNSVVHGIEAPDVRVESDKDSFGLISCNVTQKEDMIYVTIEDDGQGIDLSRIVEKAIKKGIVSELEADKISDSEILDLIFKYNFSEMDCADLYGGRGIGLTAISSTVKKFGGRIDIDNKLGFGTTFIIILPLSSLVD